MAKCVPIKIELKDLLKFEKPVQYTGNELNVVRKDWKEAKAKLCLVYPDKYEVGMSNMAVQIFYDIINNQTDHLLERAFLPETDFIDYLQKEDIPLFALESQIPLSAFDGLAFSFSTELSFTNALFALDLAQIPLLAKDRKDSDYPLVFAGGGAITNPVPMSKFFDFFVLGDGEEAIKTIGDLFYRFRGKGSEVRGKLLEALNELEYVWVPSLGKNKIVKKAVVKELDRDDLLVKNPIVPLLKVVHNRFSIEIMRGCPRGCRFCLASYTNKPVRVKKKQALLHQLKEVLKNTGYGEISLSSLSSSDYPNIARLLVEMNDYCVQSKIALSLPSLRIDSFSDEISSITNKVHQSGVTLAPEAGTQRLRNIIGKDLNEEEIIETIKVASRHTRKGIKLYFMIGLPGETMEDVEGIVKLAFRIIDNIKPARNKITINVSNFVPKPHTPFQLVKQDSIDVFKQKLGLLKAKLRHRQLELRWTDPEQSILEGILSRGNERIGEVLLAAYKNGARFDAWYDHFKFDYWEKALKETGVDLDDCLSSRENENNIPWGFINMGISKEKLMKEWQLAQQLILDSH